MKAEKPLKNIKKILILKQYKSCYDKENRIINEIKNFLKTEKILESNDKILIGKIIKQKCPRFDKNKNIIPYSFVGPDRMFMLKRRKAINFQEHYSLNDALFHKNNALINQIYHISNKQNNNNINDDSEENRSNKEKIKQESYYKIIDNGYLYNLYQTINNRIREFHSMENNKKRKNNLVNKIILNKTMNKNNFKLPESINFNLLKQEKILKNYLHFQNLMKNKNIKTVRKKKIIRKELLGNILGKNTFYKSDNNFYINDNLKNWNFKLRNHIINGKYERNGYLQTSPRNEDLYSIVNLNKEKEIIVNPLKKNKTNYMIMRNKELAKDQNIEFFGTLKINGNNLFNYEFRNEMKIQGKKKLYDFSQLNEINYKSESNEKSPELNNENNLNEIYKDKIIAYDYNYSNNNSSMKSFRKSFFNTSRTNKYKSLI